MKAAALLCLAVACAAVASAQQPGAMRSRVGSVVVDRVSVGADAAGREALCEQLRLMSTRERDVPILPDDAELVCDGDARSTFALRFKAPPTDVDKAICEFAGKPSSIVFYQMRPIALRNASPVTMPQELSEKIEPLGVRSVGRLLESFGFVNLELRREGVRKPFREIGFHELHLLCKG